MMFRIATIVLVALATATTVSAADDGNTRGQRNLYPSSCTGQKCDSSDTCCESQPTCIGNRNWATCQEEDTPGNEWNVGDAACAGHRCDTTAGVVGICATCNDKYTCYGTEYWATCEIDGSRPSDQIFEPPAPSPGPEKCCSYDRKTCVSWCDPPNCGGCNTVEITLPAPQDCLGTDAACRHNPDGCCGDLVCDGTKYWKSCQPPTTHP